MANELVIYVVVLENPHISKIDKAYTSEKLVRQRQIDLLKECNHMNWQVLSMKVIEVIEDGRTDQNSLF